MYQTVIYFKFNIVIKYYIIIVYNPQVNIFIVNLSVLKKIYRENVHKRTLP